MDRSERCRDLDGTVVAITGAGAGIGRTTARTLAAAGIGLYGGIVDHPDEAVAEMIETNVAGTVWPIRAVVPVMPPRALATS